MEIRVALESVHKGRNFLIIANGPLMLEQRDHILDVAHAKDCVTIGVNNLGDLYKPDYHVVVSQRRFEQYAASVASESNCCCPRFLVVVRSRRSLIDSHFF